MKWHIKWYEMMETDVLQLCTCLWITVSPRRLECTALQMTEGKKLLIFISILEEPFKAHTSPGFIKNDSSFYSAEVIPGGCLCK